MAASIPQAVLSESFENALKNRTVKTAVFFTFAFDPAFFEQQILPSLLDIPLSQAMEIRLVQLEDEIRQRLDQVAVYYDPRGLQASTQSPRLDVRRIPVAVQRGFFHPKNVFLLTESTDHEAGQEPTRQLIVATLSANLTEAGWWRNVECCHVEEVAEGESIGFQQDLLNLFRATRAACSDSITHEALETVRRFVVGCHQRSRISEDRLPTRLFGGRNAFVDFLSDAAKGRLQNLNLEVIAPYVDDSEAAPLKALIDKFKPRECRVFLPRAKDGVCACSQEYFAAVRRIEEATWATLPKSVMQLGPTERAAERFVHAKVYRFFHPNKRYEAIVVGSVNLTGAAHNRAGNLESAFLVETEPNQVPEWWLARLDGKPPTKFLPDTLDEDPVSRSPSVWLTLTYDWGTKSAEVEWQGDHPSPEFELLAAGISRLKLPSMRPGARNKLDATEGAAIRTALDTTALFTVRAIGCEDAPLLVREEGMAWKASILLTLSVADILRYWSLLSREQRMAFLEHVALRDPALAGTLAARRHSGASGGDSFFDNFAQIFQAFVNVEDAVRSALKAKREAEAVQRLLGEKYDSLPCLLKRVLQPDSPADPLSRYLISLCARQTLEQVRKAEPDFARAHRARFDELLALTSTTAVRHELDLGKVDQPEIFLDWFESWFVWRAAPAEEVS